MGLVGISRPLKKNDFFKNKTGPEIRPERRKTQLYSITGSGSSTLYTVPANRKAKVVQFVLRYGQTSGDFSFSMGGSGISDTLPTGTQSIQQTLAYEDGIDLVAGQSITYSSQFGASFAFVVVIEEEATESYYVY